MIVFQDFVSFLSFFRVFSDRLVDAGDHEAFVSLLSDKLGTMFDLTFHNLCPNKQPPIFGTLLVVICERTPTEIIHQTFE